MRGSREELLVKPGAHGVGSVTNLRIENFFKGATHFQGAQVEAYLALGIGGGGAGILLRPSLPTIVPRCQMLVHDLKDVRKVSGRTAIDKGIHLRSDIVAERFHLDRGPGAGLRFIELDRPDGNLRELVEKLFRKRIKQGTRIHGDDFSRGA